MRELGKEKPKMRFGGKKGVAKGLNIAQVQKDENQD